MLLADIHYEDAYERQLYRYNAQYSLDLEDGIEYTAIIRTSNDPEIALSLKDQHCSLCRALNSLPEIQGRRIEKHYINKKPIKEIAIEENADERRIRNSIHRGLRSMKINLINFQNERGFLADFCQGI